MWCFGFALYWFHAQYFLKQGRRAVKAGHYAACQEAKEEIKVTSQSIFHQKPACTNLISINTEHLLVCCTIFSSVLPWFYNLPVKFLELNLHLHM